MISTLKKNFGATNIIVKDGLITSDISEEFRDMIVEGLIEIGRSTT